MPGPPPVAVVTDSTASLPADLARELTVVPLAVVVNGVQRDDVAPDDIAQLSVTTSRPAPGEFGEVYRRLLDDGAESIVSVHISANFSGTLEVARFAAAEFAGRVELVDSHSTAMGLGFPALAAARAAHREADLSRVLAEAASAIARTTTFFYVDTLEYLRRGGRIGAASALVGTALSVKPILQTTDHGVIVRDRVRTSSRALTRLTELAVEAAGPGTVDVAVHHLAAPDRADQLANALKDRLGDRLRAAYQSEVGAVVGAHVGPGMAAVVIHRVLD